MRINVKMQADKNFKVGDIVTVRSCSSDTLPRTLVIKGVTSPKLKFPETENIEKDGPIKFTVPGQPVGKGRAKAARRGKFITMYTPEKTASYESLVAYAGNVAMNGRQLIAGPVSVELDIRLQIPTSWSNKKREQAAKGLIYAIKKPDADNVEKAIFDGMNSVVWVDDVQVVEVSKRKRYSETPGVDVIVKEL